MNQVTQDMNIMYKQSKSYYTRDKLNMDFKIKRRRGLMLGVVMHIYHNLSDVIDRDISQLTMHGYNQQ